MNSIRVSSAMLLCIVLSAFVSPVVLAGSSKENRRDKEFTVSVAPLQLMLNPGTFGTGFAGGVFVNSDLLLEIQSSSGISGGGRYTSQQTSVAAKVFLGNSFFVNGGLAQKRTIHDLAYDSPYESSYNAGTKAKITTTSFGAVFALGNRWQFSHLTLGADWVTVYAPMMVTTPTSSAYGESAVGLQRAMDEDSAGARNPGLILPQFVIGFSW